MARPRKPESELTEQQLKRRRQNDRARGNSNRYSQDESLKLVESSISQTSNTQSTNSNKNSGTQTDYQTALGYFTACLSSTVLIVCCVLSYHLQLEAYEKLALLPDIDVFGLPVNKVTAALVEVLLVMFAGIAFYGRSVLEQCTSGVLFLVIGVNTAILMINGQKAKEHQTLQLAKRSEVLSVENDYQMTALKERRLSLVKQRDLLLGQLDSANPGSYASSGAVGLVKSTFAKVEALNGKIKEIDQSSLQLRHAKTAVTRPQVSFIARTTMFSEWLRIILLVVTAFLVHFVMARFLDVNPLLLKSKWRTVAV